MARKKKPSKSENVVKPPRAEEQPVVEAVESALDPVDDVEVDVVPPIEVPTFEELIAKSFSPAAAKKIIEGFQALAAGPGADGPFRGYRVTGGRTNGFWAAGRKFGGGKATDIPIDELNEAQIAELENTDARYLTVERIGLDDEV